MSTTTYYVTSLFVDQFGEEICTVHKNVVYKNVIIMKIKYGKISSFAIKAKSPTLVYLKIC